MARSALALLALLATSLAVLTLSSSPDGVKFLKENAQKEGVVVLPSGLQYKVRAADVRRVRRGAPHAAASRPKTAARTDAIEAASAAWRTQRIGPRAAPAARRSRAACRSSQVLREGQPGGKKPLVSTPCECHYAGTLIDGTEFDSSYKRGAPTTFAPNQVIKGENTIRARRAPRRAAPLAALRLRASAAGAPAACERSTRTACR